MAVGIVLRQIFYIFGLVLLGAPDGDNSWTTCIFFWLIRFSVISILLRTYIGPWVLATLSKRIRVRSISLWSIRGLYFHGGSQTWRIERISYVWSSSRGSRRLAVKIDGLSLDIGNIKESAVTPIRRHNRNLTLADLNPSPIAYALWKALARIFATLEPWFRPIIRTLVVTCLKIGIQWLPAITQALSFELHSPSVSFSQIPGTKVTIEDMSLHMTLQFTQTGESPDVEQLPKKSTSAQKFYGVNAWKRRLIASFQRSLDRAWGGTQGTATATIRLCDVSGITQAPLNGESADFLLLPGAIDFGASVRFNPRVGSLVKHSLETSLVVGECFIKVDVVNTILTRLKMSKTSSSALRYLSEDFPFPDTLLYQSSPTPSSQHSSSQPPRTSVMSSMFETYPRSGPLPTLSRFPNSPSSPFLRAISASIRPRYRYAQPCVKLKEADDMSLLSVARNVQVSFASITLSFSGNNDELSYTGLLQNVSAAVRLSDPALDPLHQKWIGRAPKAECFDPNNYTFTFTLQKTIVERRSNLKSIRLLRLGVIDLQALASQWPSPWLVVSPFMTGDPNAPFLALRMNIDGVQFTDHLDHLRNLLDQLPRKNNTESSHNKKLPYSLPRLAVEIKCGLIGVRLVCSSPKESDRLAVELRIKGFLLSSQSSFSDLITSTNNRSRFDHLPVRMVTRFNLIFEPIFVRSRSQWNSSNVGKQLHSEKDFMDDPALLSLEMLDISGSAIARGVIDNCFDGVTSLDSTSFIYDIHVSSDAFCFELWHPHSISAATHLIALIDSATHPSGSTVEDVSRENLSRSLTIRVALARIVVLVTARDIHARDALEPTRGVALRTSLLFDYSTVQHHHASEFTYSSNIHTRAKLSLPTDSSVNAAGSALTFKDVASCVHCFASGFTLRSAVATPFEPDDSTILGRDDLIHSRQEFLQIPTTHTTVHLSRSPLTQLEGYNRGGIVYSISMHIPRIRGEFSLAHAYNVLLAQQTINKLISIRPARPVQVRTGNYPSITFKLNVENIQIIWMLSNLQVFTRLHDFQLTWSPQTTPSMHLAEIKAYFPITVQSPICVGAVDDRWEESLTIYNCDVSFPSQNGPLSIAVIANGVSFRIPCGFVLADLVLDATIAIKAFRHLLNVTKEGVYSEIPSPSAEGPKFVPTMTFQVNSLCLEAADDPLERKLSIIWQEGAEATKQRLSREDAFQAKVAAILAAAEDTSKGVTPENDEYQFSSKHTVSIEDARRRLDEVHVLDWTLRLERARDAQAKAEKATVHDIMGPAPTSKGSKTPDLVTPSPKDTGPPLLRAIMHNLSLEIRSPSFPIGELPDFLLKQGDLPLGTQFSLLIPMHINFTLSSLHVTLRDYPLPLVHIVAHENPSTPSWTFDTDLVIGEEMGSELSVDWISCLITEGAAGTLPFFISVPKTIMPVKSYASPSITISSPTATILSWSVSYGPAIQDLMRIVETLSSLTRDSSPVMGFWDKMRLVFHWTAKASFHQDVCLYMKGSRNPYDIADAGAGFVLCWQGSPEILLGYKNDQRELIQVNSEEMIIAIPNLDQFSPNSLLNAARRPLEKPNPFQKICAKFSSGVRYGIGCVLERSCGDECRHCFGPASQRKCRIFTFRPHHEVCLVKKTVVPTRKGGDDSYNGFRSDFIHLSVSLASSIVVSMRGDDQKSSSLHLTPKTFAHFWSWWSLFDNLLSLPIRQGSYYPPRPISPKLGRHLATIKYKIVVPKLFVMHGYIDDSRETWVDGVTPWVGVKAMIDEFQVDMHQREEEIMVPGSIPETNKLIRRKPFYAAEVVLKGLDLRTMLAIFDDPLKEYAHMTAPAQRSNYRKHVDLPQTPVSSPWYDLRDFVELDSPSIVPSHLHILPFGACPRFTYFKRNSAAQETGKQASKFGIEASHSCLLGQEPTVPQVQISVANDRMRELQTSMSGEQDCPSLKKRALLLEEYIAVLRESQSKECRNTTNDQIYHMPSDIVSPHEWAEFDHVYQVHCPTIFMSSPIRDIMMQYYYCSRSRRGLEYHMAARSVKFIRDQANAVLAKQVNLNDKGKTSTAQMAASALRKILKGDSTKTSMDSSQDLGGGQPTTTIDPLEGWADNVSLKKSHCCLLLKAQIVMSGESIKDTVIIAAAQAKLQSFAIMDKSNLDDPISGKVMSRNYTSISGLQAFAPTHSQPMGDGSVPLEVLIDLRYSSHDFERLVPQTDATFHYDKFNRLRLRNDVTSIVIRTSTDKSENLSDNHLHDQTDLIRVHIPRFTVSANDEHFQTISTIVTKLLLFSDAAHKTRLDRLETLLFTYDFTDLQSAATVVTDLQCRLRDAMETERLTIRGHRRAEGEEGKIGMLTLKAHIFLLAEELNLLFDAIKLAQDRFDDRTDQKSALLLHTSSSEISWRMLDEKRNLISKLVVQDINYHWLSRQDSSTVNNLMVGDLTAFDGSRYAIWAEILSKHDEPVNHPLLKKGLFLLANWTILAPVGGITIYEAFELELHPLRLQIDAKVGRRILEYVWPARRHRQNSINNTTPQISQERERPRSPKLAVRSSLDSPRALYGFSNQNLAPPLRKLGPSRSFTDLRSTRESSFLHPPLIHKTHSIESLRSLADASVTVDNPAVGRWTGSQTADDKAAGDAAEMKTRSSQKTFVLVKLSSLNLLLSIVKEGSFECHDARIRTRDLEYRNQTWSFEELVNQFIPSDMGWRGWAKMVFHQPLIPVLPVARELISKTKWTSSKTGGQTHDSPLQLPHPTILGQENDSGVTLRRSGSSSRSPSQQWSSSFPIASGPDQLSENPKVSTTRQRMRSLFGKASPRIGKSQGSQKSIDARPSLSDKPVGN